jgi:methanethiol S-methyltransferase
MEMNILILVLAVAAWGAVHSVTASLEAKAALQRTAGERAARLYRLGYNIFSVISFLPIVWLRLTLPDAPLYRVPAPWSYVMIAGQALGLLLLAVGVLHTDTLSFIGLRQLFEAPRQGGLVTRGLYRWVRHPLYSAGLLILWLTPVMTVNTLVLYAGLSLYILIGAWFEERKLVREFGGAYEDYRRSTPMLIPGLRRGK